MILFLRITGLFAFTSMLALVIGRLWVGNPEIFPSLPSALWNWLDARYGSADAEQVADLELLVTSGFSAIMLWIFFFLLFIGRSSACKKRKSTAPLIRDKK
jgi:hypothetical protein